MLDDVGEIFPSTGLRGMLSTLKTALSNGGDNDDKIDDKDQDEAKQAGDDDESKSDDISSSTYVVAS